jgi:glycosyltransferase involved in cell wall biosynthesis
MWFQLGLPDARGAIDRWATRMPACGILACSRAVAVAQIALNPARRVKAVHLGVELERFDASSLSSVDDARLQLNLPAGVPIVGIVGRLQHWKGIHVLIEAMPAVLREFGDARCVVVGGVHDLEPDYPAFLNQRIAELGLNNRVLMAGLQKNVPEWMQAMDVIVHASDNEPFGLVVIEGMAMGKAVIAGAGCGPSEIITTGINGFLTPFGDAAALADAVLRYLRDPLLRQSMGDAARRRARDFSTERFAQSIVTSIRGLLDPVGTT